MTDELRALWCRIVGHRLKPIAEAKRRCDRCKREEWLFSKPYPRIGEAKYSWRHVPWNKVRF